jgi:hypothetical protein
MDDDNIGAKISLTSTETEWTGLMRTIARLTVSFIGLALVSGSLPLATAAQHEVSRTGAKTAKGAHHTTAKGTRPVFRPSRVAAAQEAARLGALVGNECRGKADLQRNDRQWVVLCSSGKTYVVEPLGQPGAAPATECSLAGTGPQPPCLP